MKKICWLLLLFPFAVQAQFSYNGIVKDAFSKKTLPYASIIAPDGQLILCDMDGKFSINTAENWTHFTVTYIGFTTKEIPVLKTKEFYTVLLNQTTFDLKSVPVSNEDQALQMIRKVIQNKNQNDPKKVMKSFELKSYTKLVITANPDSINGRIDSLLVKKTNGTITYKIDSSYYRFKKMIVKQHLFQTEKVSQFQFRGKKLKETILGTKMAGLKKPIYELLAIHFQSFSIYDKQLELFENKYNSPISVSNYLDYSFHLFDTISIQGRKTSIVYFKNKTRKTGLEGILYIDQISFAIARANFGTKGLLRLSSEYEYNYIPDKNVWFPSKNKIRIVKGKNNYNLRILGETLPFDPEDETQSKSRKKVAVDFAYLESETDFFDTKFDHPITLKNRFVALELDKNAEIREAPFWNTFRKDTINLKRHIQTYSALDSLVTKKKIEKRLFFGRKILYGYMPFGMFDLDLRYLVSFNNFEGFRLGLGGKTSEKFSKKFRIDGYTAYGIKDKNHKYNLGSAFRLEKYSNSWLGIAYTDDIQEIGSTAFSIDKRVFKLYNPRPINVSTFYSYQSWRLYFETKLIPKTESIWQINVAQITPEFSYVFNYNNLLYSSYRMTTAQVSMQWNPFSYYMLTEDGRFEAKRRYPRFTFQYTQSIPNWFSNDFNFGKIDFKTEIEKNYLNGQKSIVFIEAGYAFGTIPLTHLYSTSPNNLSKEKLIQRITIAGKNSFETMFFNEFFSNRFAALHLKHGFKRVPLFRKVKPAIVLVSRMAWGGLSKPQQHIGFNYKTLEKGFFESGIEINQIYKGLGLSGFYRYGPNQLPKFEDNLSIKLSFILNLDF